SGGGSAASGGGSAASGGGSAASGGGTAASGGGMSDAGGSGGGMSDAGGSGGGMSDAGGSGGGMSDAGSDAGVDPCTGIVCQSNATCSSASGSAVCGCNAGYQDKDQNGSCTATCATAALSCQTNASCSDTSGTAACGCNSGYQDNDQNGSCTATCATAALSCSGHGACSDSQGTAACVCNAGFAESTCSACVRYVNAAATGTGAGTSWANAFTSLQSALDSASTAVSSSSGALTSCEVWVAAGTYRTYASARTDTFTLKSNTWLFGGFTGTESSRASRDSVAHVTVLTGKSADGLNQSYRVLRASGITNAQVDGFEVTGANANAANPNDRGPGLYSSSSSLTVGHMNFHDLNAGAEGGAIASASDTALTVQSSTVSSNSAGQHGGGIYVVSPVQVTLDGVTVKNNTSVLQGGGVHLIAGSTGKLTVKNSTLTGNQSGAGNGLYAAGGLLSVDQSTLSYNRGGDGAAIFVFNPTTGSKVTRSLIVGNIGGWGGALCDNSNSATGATITLENDVLAGNISGSGGGAVARLNGVNPISIVNSTLYGNRSRSVSNGNAFHTPVGPAFSVANSIITGHHAYGGIDFTAATPPALDTCVVDDAALGVGTNRNVSPGLTAAPLFYDLTTAGGTTTTLVVSDASKYAVGQALRLSGATDATITGLDVPTGTLTITPALSAASTANTLLADWGVSPATTTEDFTLSSGSACIDSANGALAPTSDLTGKARVDDPAVTNTGTGSPDYADVGAYER
ncbi:MAG: hypothetical protein K1X89_31490, partial [Myxococcaceae bacterium]|nr:hypothetical protein [Myxococcaceae bacterium]